MNEKYREDRREPDEEAVELMIESLLDCDVIVYDSWEISEDGKDIVLASRTIVFND